MTQAVLSPTAIRHALAATLTGHDVTVVPAAIEYDKQPGIDRFRFDVTVVIPGSPDDPVTQAAMDDMLAPAGALSVKSALEADPTLDGLVIDLHVARSTGYRVFKRDEQDRLGAVWTVETTT